jgi:2-methylcitrate dehydratase PrpD
MDYIRDTIDGQITPSVLGYTSTVFGATAAVARLRGASAEVTSHAIAIAAANSPVNSHRSWLEHLPTATIKYTMAGPVTQVALMAAFNALLGHTGDPGVLDDVEFGYPRFIGTTRWAPDRMLAGIGETWYFPNENSFKHYPHCRAQHGLFDLLVDVLNENNIATSEITAIRAQGEGHVERALWLNSEVTNIVEAQFSIAHGMAVAAQRLTPSKEWQSDEVVYSPQVLDLARVVTYATHPEWQDAIVNDPLARPSRVEVDARGTTFEAELRYPRGTAGDAHTTMSDDELAAKFLINVSGVLNDAQARRALDMLMSLDSAPDVRPVLRSLADPSSSRVKDVPRGIPTPRSERGPADKPA